MNEKSSSTDGKSMYPWQKSYRSGLEWTKKYTSEPHFRMLERSVEHFGDHICTYFVGKETSYKEIGKLADKVAQGLQEMGIKKGDKIGLFLPNTPTYIYYYFGILKAGGVVVNYNPLYSQDELEFQIKNSETKYMVTLDLKLLFEKCEALMEAGVLDHTIIASFTKLLPTPKSLLFKLFKSSQLSKISASPMADRCILEEQLLNNNGQPQPVEINPEVDLAVLQYTGGTTGRPKGAQLSHANVSIQTAQVVDCCVMLDDGTESIMGILPFFHVFAMTVVMNVGLAIGARLILVPKFELEDALKLMRKTKPTCMPGVPTLYNAIANKKPPAKEAVASLKFCISGGAPLPPDVVEKFKLISDAAVIEGYGLSETSPVLTCNILGDEPKAGSIGMPLPDTIVSIRSLDDPAIEMPQGEKGEICAKGPQVMNGYWHAPDETEKVFVGDYFRTGDVGYVDEEGYFFIVDRLKDLIICSGYNVYPRRIEDVIYDLPEVDEVTVIGIPDDYRGEAPKAFIKLHKGAKLSAEQVMEHLNKKLSKLELPAEIEFKDELPKTMVGKLSKKELREEA
ncbi:MAG: dicarboxylate--CoA ligase PimA [Rhodomicrobium sp.]|nr:MAG: dicarboxylate--CoA ligase PimA [Rhodomicrobium sp.]